MRRRILLIVFSCILLILSLVIFRIRNDTEVGRRVAGQGYLEAGAVGKERLSVAEHLHLLLAVDRERHTVPDIVVPCDLENLLADIYEFLVGGSGVNQLTVVLLHG